MKDERPSKHCRRGALAVCLTFLALTAPAMIVCEGPGHAAIEWVFSSCCKSSGVGNVSQSAASHGSSGVRIGAQDGRCADTCVDSTLLAFTPKPAVSIAPHVPMSVAGPGVLTSMLPAVELAGYPTHPVPTACPPFAADLSTVLLI